MIWNLLHLAQMLRDGLLDEGKDRNERAVGTRFGLESPKYRS